MADNPPPQSSIILYQTEDGRTRIQCRFENETIWLTQAQIAELFQKDVRTINEHLVNIFEEGELSREATIRKFRIVRSEGRREVAREIEHYNLDAILAVGFRVRSHRGTQFRQWAIGRLNEYLVKGFTMDDERLKNPPGPGHRDYFDELLERIREIRASERRFYQKVTDIYALSVDYDATAPLTQEFFASVQNKLHWAITGQTAAELIYASADATRLFMGLSTWKHAPHGKILKSDVTVAKNYLSEEHVKELNRIVSAYLDLAENRAHRGTLMRMADWASFLNGFLELSSYPILTDKGTVSALEAKLKAEGEYAVYRRRQDAEYLSDFDRVVQEARRLGGKPAPKALQRSRGSKKR